jgi:hypothetical protein
MPFEYYLEKKDSKLKPNRLKWLPRFGLYLDFGGYEVYLKYTPLFETIVEAFNSGKITKNQIQHILKKQLQEIHFPLTGKKIIVDIPSQKK